MISWSDLVPWNAARSIFESPDAPYEPTYGLSWARSILGLVAVVTTSLQYRELYEILEEVWGKAAQASGISGVVLAFLLPFVLIVMRRRGVSLINQGGWRGFFTAVVSGLGTVGLAYLVFVRSFTMPNAIASLLYAAFLVWFSLFAVCAALFAARSVFRVGELNPVIGPSVATLVAAYMFSAELIESDTKGLPFALWFILGVGGFASAAAIGALEIRVGWDSSWNLAVRSPATSSVSGLKSTPDAATTRQVATFTVLLVSVVGAGAFLLVWRSFGGGLITFAALSFLSFLGLREVWLRWGGSFEDLFRQ